MSIELSEQGIIVGIFRDIYRLYAVTTLDIFVIRWI